jgi:hypothetical protein
MGGWDFCTTTTPIASKDYDCDAAVWLENCDTWEFTEAEQDIIADANNQGNKILKGTRYKKTVGRFDGEFCVFRARLDLDAICLDNDVYDD